MSQVSNKSWNGCEVGQVQSLHVMYKGAFILQGSNCLLFKSAVNTFWLCFEKHTQQTRYIEPMLAHRLRRWPNIGSTFHV